MDVWLEVWKTFGWLGLFALAYARGWLATGREVKQLEDELARERTERIHERTDLRHEITYWRDLTWSFSRIADQVAGALPPNKDSG